MRQFRNTIPKKKLLNNGQFMRKLILVLIWIFFVVFAYKYSTIWDTAISHQDFIINKWETLNILPKKLGFDVNNYLYKIWIKLNYSSFNLQSGSYSINSNTNLDNLFQNVLKNPDSKDIKITILPGWNIFDIDDYLSSNWIIKTWDLIEISKNLSSDLRQKYSFLKDTKTLEWYLYPDTYKISPDSDVVKIVEIMLDEFSKKIKTSELLYSDMIMASIVEREEKNSENKPIVAGILKKRLAEWMAIWADATVCYEFELTQKECTPAFIWEKIYQKSVYNTRSEPGLPPTPISNFSASTFEATINSESSPYYYYLHDSNWQIHYGKTLQEHNNNKAKYL